MVMIFQGILRNIYVVVCLLPTLWCSSPNNRSNIIPVLEWTNLEFDYASLEERQQAIDSGEFDVVAPIPIDVDVYFSKNGERQVFVSVPRFVNGIPATFTILTDRTYNNNPVLAPFPSWEWHRNVTSCPTNRIVSVFRSKIDQCGRLWVLDSARIGTAPTAPRACPPQLLAFDVETHELLVRYEIPESQLGPNALLATPLADILNPEVSCEDAYIYLADSGSFGLIVYDVRNRVSWRYDNPSFDADPNFTTYRVNGFSFNIVDGILGLGLSPRRRDGNRILYYHAMSSGTENWVYTTYLHNETQDPSIFNTYPGTRDTQCPPLAIDRRGIAYFGLVSRNTLNCWNTATDYGEENIDDVAYDRDILQFLTGVKMITNPMGTEDVWFVNVPMYRFATGTLNLSSINYGVYRANTNELIRNSSCLIK